MESCNTESSLDLPLESLSLQPFLQSLHKEQWQEVRLGEVAEMNNGKARPKNYGDYPIYGGNGILGYGNQYNCDSETIIVGRVGAYCGCVYYEKQPIWVSDNAIIVKAKSENNIKFLYYVLKSMKLNDYALGSSHPLLTQNLLNTLQVEIPKDITTQQKIAEILSSFDDKIDLLHRQNKTLESLALTLFRHYFIDNPKRDEWEEKPLSEVAYFLNGLACQKLPPRNDKDRLPVLKIKELKEGISQTSDWATSEIDSQYIVENGDVIFAWSASLMVKMWNGSQCVLNQHLFKVTSQVYPKWFYYFWCKYHLQDFIAIANAHATTMGHIKRQDLDLAMCVIPDTQSLQTIDKEIAPLLQKININSKQIQNLQAMRDMLLKAIFA